MGWRLAHPKEIWREAVVSLVRPWTPKSRHGAKQHLRVSVPAWQKSARPGPVSTIGPMVHDDDAVGHFGATPNVVRDR